MPESRMLTIASGEAGKSTDHRSDLCVVRLCPARPEDPDQDRLLLLHESEVPQIFGVRVAGAGRELSRQNGMPHRRSGASHHQRCRSVVSTD
jgi:hypothetical protein